MPTISKFMSSALTLIICAAFPAFGQSAWDDDEIDEIFSGIRFDVEAAITSVEGRGITPYDFGRDLLQLGQGEKAIEWYQAIAIATKDPQYVYGLAWVKWKTGDNAGALQDAYYLIKKDLPPLIRARTLYLLGCINIDERRFDDADRDLKAAFEAYGQIPGKYGGQYLALTMRAWGAIYTKKFDEVEPLLDRALAYNERLRDIGLEPYGLGYRHEIIGEMYFAQGDYHSALAATLESEAAYRESGEIFRQAWTALARSAANINQLAHHLNENRITGRAGTVDAAVLRAELRRMYGHIAALCRLLAGEVAS